MRQKAEQDKKPMSFSLKAGRTVPPVIADPERLRQILRILLDNAYHYTPENGVVAVNVRIPRGRSEIQVDVMDNGIGIAASEQDRVFERFFRGENPLILATPGTGLGLSIARQLVEMHGGRISLESRGVEGEGSTFTFTLPLGPASPQDEGTAPPLVEKRPRRRAAKAASSTK
jgi:signal transduction histidine kinase